MRIGQYYEMEDKDIGRTWIVFPVLVELEAEPVITLDWEQTQYKWIKPSNLNRYKTPCDLALSLACVL